MTPYHARYFAHELTRQRQPNGVDRLSMALFDACVDLNPHQIDAAAFALRNPAGKGVLLADEVGLGKTIEAGLVLCQHWAERKRKLLVICPASIRKQWGLELQEKFNLPSVILDSSTFKQEQRAGNAQPFLTDRVVITSLNFASKMKAEIRAIPFNLVVLDEAHKLRNCYRPSNQMGQNIKWAIEERKKLLLTATPLQNSLVELFGISTILDDMIFGDLTSFRSQYTGYDGDMTALRDRLHHFCQRTLRRQVIEYIQYTERRPLTFQFRPTDDEQKLYESVSAYLMRENTFAFPKRQRHLTALILRKLLASSSHAVASTLETMNARLSKLRDGLPIADHLAEELISEEEIEEDLLDEILEGTEDGDEAPDDDSEPAPTRQALNSEIDELGRYSTWARSIGIDTKSRSLLKALDVGLNEMQKMGANRKALVFTESRRTQEYLKTFLEANGFAGQIVLFNGTNSDPESRQILDRWIETNSDTGRATGSRPIDSRTALIEHFRDSATVMIATEAAAEGVNLQFCSLVVNYDLPWNPQRIERGLAGAIATVRSTMSSSSTFSTNATRPTVVFTNYWPRSLIFSAASLVPLMRCWAVLNREWILRDESSPSTNSAAPQTRSPLPSNGFNTRWRNRSRPGWKTPGSCYLSDLMKMSMPVSTCGSAMRSRTLTAFPECTGRSRNSSSLITLPLLTPALLLTCIHHRPMSSGLAGII